MDANIPGVVISIRAILLKEGHLLVTCLGIQGCVVIWDGRHLGSLTLLPFWDLYTTKPILVLSGVCCRMLSSSEFLPPSALSYFLEVVFQFTSGISPEKFMKGRTEERDWNR